MEQLATPSSTASQIQEILQRVTRIETMTEGNHQMLHGDSSNKGLQARVTRLETDVVSLKTQQSAIQDLTDKVLEMRENMASMMEYKAGMSDIRALLSALQSDVKLLQGKNDWWKEAVAIVIAILSAGFTAYMAFK